MGNNPDKPSEGVISQEVKDLYANGREMEHAEGNGSSPEETGIHDLPGGAALNGLLRIAPFSAYLVHRAKLEYQHQTLQGRVKQYCKDHPWQKNFCTIADLTLRTIVVIFLLAVVAMVILKALFPLPF